jgi:hypothetical protein
MAIEGKKSRGMPIHLDPTERQLASFDSEAGSSKWYPSNRAAFKLWRSIEALRDLKLILEIIRANPAGEKRNLKIATTQLHTLATTVHDLGNYFASDDSLKKNLSEADSSLIKRVNKDLSQNVPVRKNSDFDKLRNKLSAHIDAELYPAETRNLAEPLNSSSFYKWLAHSIKALIELLNLDLYHWTCESAVPNSVSIMCREPFIVTLTFPPDTRIISLNIANESPRSEVPKLCSDVLALADWMRPPGTPMLKLTEEPTGEL